jgi:cyanophycin synthetase
MPGESYRLLYLDGKLLHAVRRRGLRVTGDGKSSIRELLSRTRGDEITLGSLELETLAAQGLGSSSVAAAGASVLVRGVPPGGSAIERRTIYDEDATHLISTAVDREVRRVVEAVGSSFAGVDIVTPDPSRSLAQSGGAFLEINTTPGIHHHYITEQDRKDHPVAVAVLRSLLSPTDRESHEYPESFSRPRKAGAEITHPYVLESL